MEIVFAAVPYVLVALLVAILGVLVFGVVAMGSKRFSPAFRNKLMRLRVALHALLVLILLALLASTAWSSGS
jgi:hypothetical protein